MLISLTNVQKRIPVPAAAIKSTAGRAAARLKLKHPELSLVFVGEQRMRRINREYLGHDYVTDVITFDHGEIIICPRVAARNAKAYGTSTLQELKLYVVHGLLHLAGYDDHAPADIRRMRDMEEKLLRT